MSNPLPAPSSGENRPTRYYPDGISQAALMRLVADNLQPLVDAEPVEVSAPAEAARLVGMLFSQEAIIANPRGAGAAYMGLLDLCERFLRKHFHEPGVPIEQLELDDGDRDDQHVLQAAYSVPAIGGARYIRRDMLTKAQVDGIAARFKATGARYTRKGEALLIWWAMEHPNGERKD